MKKVFKTLLSIIAGALVYFLVSLISGFIISVLLYLLSKIPPFSFLLRFLTHTPSYLDDGLRSYSFIGWYIYAPSVVLAHKAMSKTIQKISGADKTEENSLLTIGAFIFILHAISIVINIIGTITGTADFNSVMINIVFIISAISILSESRKY